MELTIEGTGEKKKKNKNKQACGNVRQFVSQTQYVWDIDSAVVFPSLFSLGSHFGMSFIGLTVPDVMLYVLFLSDGNKMIAAGPK